MFSGGEKNFLCLVIFCYRQYRNYRFNQNIYFYSFVNYAYYFVVF
jgi:hypothetical protein